MFSLVEVMSNDFPVQSKCSNITEQDIRNMNWIRVSIAIAGFAMVALMLFIVLLRREFKSVLERLFIYLLLATFLRELVLLSNIEHQFEYKWMDEVCGVLGALDLYTAVLVIIYVASTIMYLLTRVVDIKLVRQRSRAFANSFELGFFLLTFFIPLIVSVGLLYTNIFGLSIAWCWMREYDGQCHKTNSLKKIFGGYSVILITGILSIFLTAAIVIIYYKIARRIKQATDLLKQAVILIVCLIVNVLIVVFATVVVNLTAVELKFIILYVYTTIVSLYDLIYPLGFLLSLRYRAISSFASTKKRRSTYTILSNNNATAPASDRVSAPSTTAPISFPYTGQFTTID